MVQLSLLEEIKDKASRLIPTAYMEVVEECTAPHLLIPTYEHVKFLCDTVNRKPEALVDVVRALRRRITDANVAVKHLTIQLLEPMIKNCSTPFHVELASQKGLLRDLVAVACLHPTTGRAMQAKEAALLLILNLSIWFRGHPAKETFLLTTLADDVRSEMGPNCFEGLEPERDAHLKVHVDAPNRPRQQSGQRADASPGDHGARFRGQRRERRTIVDAVPIDLPTPERVSAMLETCMAFSEYVNNAEMNPEVRLCDDDVVQSYMSQVRKDHDYVTILLSSNLQVDRDVQQTVSVSQSAVIQKVESAIAQQRLDPKSTGPTTIPSGPERAAVRSAGDTEQPRGSSPTLQEAGAPLRETPLDSGVPNAGIDVAGSVSAPDAFIPPAAAPTVEDLFGDLQSAPQATASISTPLVLSTGEAASVPGPRSQTPTEEMTAALTPVVGDDVDTTTSGHLHPQTPPPPAEPREREAAPAEPQPAAPESAPVVDSAVTLAPATLTPPREDDDFDAFLESHATS